MIVTGDFHGTLKTGLFLINIYFDPSSVINAIKPGMVRLVIVAPRVRALVLS